MRLLLDECLDGRDAVALRAAGHDVLSVSECLSGADDRTVLRHACETQRILITLDNDFGRLVVAEGLQHCGLLRLTGFSGNEEPTACLSALRRFGDELQRGALVVFEPDRSRVREAN